MEEPEFVNCWGEFMVIPHSVLDSNGKPFTSGDTETAIQDSQLC